MVGCAIISDNHCNIQHIPGGSLIFTAEAFNIESFEPNKFKESTI